MIKQYPNSVFTIKLCKCFLSGGGGARHRAAKKVSLCGSVPIVPKINKSVREEA